MKHQVSTDLHFASKADQDEVFTYLNSKRSLAMKERGDFITIETTSTGEYRVSCVLRMTQQTDRDEVKTFLSTKKSKASKGHIEGHICNHDNEEPCTDSIVDSWGDVM